jgi:beta-fructofuranosidase
MGAGEENPVRCFLGDFDGRSFVPADVFELDYGRSFYAPARMLDGERVLLWGWLREERPQAAAEGAGWSGALSVPRALSLAEDGGLRVEPAPELEKLRGAHSRFGGLRVAPGSSGHLGGLASRSLELDALFEAGGAEAFGLRVLASPEPGGGEETLVKCDLRREELAVVRGRSSLDAGARRADCRGRFVPREESRVRLRVFVDRSVVEVYADDSKTATARVYPTRAESAHVDLFAEGGEARLVSLDAWEMEPVWPV